MTPRDLDRNDNNAPEQASPARVQARTRHLTCAHCAKQIEHRAGRRPRFCGSRCRMRAKGQRRVAATYRALNSIPVQVLDLIRAQDEAGAASKG